MSGNGITLALPSKGSLQEGTVRFLESCGLRVSRGARQYSGSIDGIGGVQLTFARAEEIPKRVAEGTADAGITGLDLFREDEEHGDKLTCVLDGLGFGNARLAVAVPQAWIDVNSITDLLELSPEFYTRYGRAMIVGTSFPNLARHFFARRGLAIYALVQGLGALEAMPSSGRADLIVDLTSTGRTLSENGLKEISGGTVLESQACLIANTERLGDAPAKAVIDTLKERIEAALLSENLVQVQAVLDSVSDNLRNGLAQAGADIRLLESEAGGGLAIIDGPRKSLDRIVSLLNDAGSTSITVLRPEFVYRY